MGDAHIFGYSSLVNRATHRMTPAWPGHLSRLGVRLIRPGPAFTFT